MRKSELVEIIARKAHLTKKATLEAIETFLSEIQKALVKGEKVILSGFGTFRVVSVKDKAVIIPKTGEKKIIKSHRAPRFSPGRSLRKIIKG
ncbi:MAG: HU family DNA-binding protein [Patescibacteria group bacterium]